MQQGRTAGKTFIPTRFIDFFESPFRGQRDIAKEIARAEKGITAVGIRTKTGYSLPAIRSVIRTMRGFKGVYISGWCRTTNTGIAAVYSVGNLPDVAKPLSKRAKADAAKSTIPPPLPEQKLIEQDTYYSDLAKALVPQRNAQEQWEVNWKYLCHISPGVVKYLSATT